VRIVLLQVLLSFALFTPAFCACDGECLRKMKDNEQTQLFLNSIKLQSLNGEGGGPSDLNNCQKEAAELKAAGDAAAEKERELMAAIPVEKELNSLQAEIDKIRKNSPGITGAHVREADTGRSGLLRKLEADKAELFKVSSMINRTLPAEINSLSGKFAKEEQAKARESGRKLALEFSLYFKSCSAYLDSVIRCLKSNVSIRGCREQPFNCHEPAVFKELPAGAISIGSNHLNKLGIPMRGYSGLCRPFREYYADLVQEARDVRPGATKVENSSPKDRRNAEQAVKLAGLLRDRDRLYDEYSSHMANSRAAGRREEEARDRHSKLIAEFGSCGEDGECVAKIGDFRPAEEELYIKKGLPVKMPAITATSKAGNSRWRYKTKFVGQLRLCECAAVEEGNWFYLSKAMPGEICGGDYSLQVSVNCGGRTNIWKQDVRIGRIKGEDPSPEEVKSRVELEAKQRGCEGDTDILKRIACHESRLKQFSADKMPLTGYPHDFGIFQISSPKDKVFHCRTAWDWQLNIEAGVGIFLEKKSAVAAHELTEKGGVAAVLPGGGQYWRPRNGPLSECIKKALGDKLVGLSENGRQRLIAAFPIEALSFRQRQIENIKRYNGKREYKYSPIDEDEGFSPLEGCRGKWEPVGTSENGDPRHTEYVTKVLAIDPETCKESGNK